MSCARSMRCPGAMGLKLWRMKVRGGTRCRMALTVVSRIVGCLCAATASRASAAMRRAAISELGPMRS